MVSQHVNTFFTWMRKNGKYADGERCAPITWKQSVASSPYAKVCNVCGCKNAQRFLDQKQIQERLEHVLSEGTISWVFKSIVHFYSCKCYGLLHMGR